jgi:[citrate (pro-3S)-lyase] ligase
VSADYWDKSSIGAVIVNCNPFTLGHQYLIEYAASRCQLLHIFVLQEDRSSFPSAIRYSLVKAGVKHLNNVILHKGKDYIISDATFPTYFIKENRDVVDTHARLDLELFTHYIAPSLGINKRFVGEEPYCEVTAAYNSIMNETLPRKGIGVLIVPRMMHEGTPISASRVRMLIHDDKFQELKALVPETTYQFLLSSEAEEIIQGIKKDHKRH